MKRIWLFISFLFCSMFLSAQDYSVISLEHLIRDMSARENIKSDELGRQCAVFRIATQNIASGQREGFFFECDYGSYIVDYKVINGEIWVWVSPGIKTMKIIHRKLGRYDLQVATMLAQPVEPLHTYRMVLQGNAVAQPEVKEVTQQYLVFQITPSNAVLEVDDEVWDVAADGTAMRFVNFGTYHYRVRASNYLPVEGSVTVDDPETTKVMSVTLKPNYVVVTLLVNADAEIWVNNEHKGTRSWTGAMGRGVYKIECKQAGHETSVISKEITLDMEGQTITLPAPIPIYGSLLVESTPMFCELSIDGHDVGPTPQMINEILIGPHTVRLVKEGYADYYETVTIVRDEPASVKATLTYGSQVQFTCNVPDAQLEIDGHHLGNATGNYQIAFGNHFLKVTAQNYADHTSVLNVNGSSMSQDIVMRKTDVGIEGALPGLFSVAPGRQICFAQGNLQFNASTDSLCFAAHQWDYIGNGNKNLSSSYDGWIDLLGWGTGNDPSKASLEGDDYVDFTDWGDLLGGPWRTLTKEEWVYVLENRNTNSGVRFVKATVAGVKGLILLPDDWNTACYMLRNTNDAEASFGSNVMSPSVWTDRLEAHGAVFLPAAGCRRGAAVSELGSWGYYWSSTPNKDGRAHVLYFGDDYLRPDGWNNRCEGRSVRLVCTPVAQ